MTLSQFFQSCSILPGSITSHDSNEDFLGEFQQLLRSPEARDTSNVLYAFVCEKEIPRVMGESNIIYIGRAAKGLENRYWGSWLRRNWSPANLEFINYVIEHYGPVRLAYLVIGATQSLKEVELDLLKDYYELHMELPPKNAQGYGSWSGR
jgi:hypothetical protein